MKAKEKSVRDAREEIYMSEKTNEAYLRIHNVRTVLELVVSFLEHCDEPDAAEKVYYALSVALDEAGRAESAIGG